MKNLRTFALGTVTLTLLGSVPLIAQEPKGETKNRTPGTAAPAPPSTGTARPNDAIHRVPDFFGQVGLSPEQREQIYKLRETHFQKIQVLEKQIAEARAAMLADCEKVLTPTQKELLLARRKAAEERRALRASATRPSTGDAATKKPQP